MAAAERKAAVGTRREMLCFGVRLPRVRGERSCGERPTCHAPPLSGGRGRRRKPPLSRPPPATWQRPGGGLQPPGILSRAAPRSSWQRIPAAGLRTAGWGGASLRSAPLSGLTCRCSRGCCLFSLQGCFHHHQTFLHTLAQLA